MTVPSGHLSFFFSRERERQEIAEVRRTMLDKLLYVFSLVGLPAVVFGAIQSYKQGRWVFSITYPAIYLLFLLTTFAARRFPYRIRAQVLVSSLFLVALAILLRIGMSGVGLQLMLGVCFLAALLFGFRGGMLAILVSLVSITLNA
jgi:hypothetical protein